MTKNKAIEAYRDITGACATGTRMFLEGLSKIKRRYAIGEIIELTKGEYGNRTFAQFFGVTE